ncbi:hypothetical protein H4219_001935 [Mycoemilia scoparia]|uniref:Velvet domain-containing protein n=1 Tax=Mycoemilia scoparia TaxID=417184 RepID=A0A9W8A2C2_9FUNG|nr:hypothetical protein H4219_001935 [Mycoemilia scoparia]
MYATLMDESATQELIKLPERQARTMTGSVVSSLAHLKDIDGTEGAFFVFPDLSVRSEGSYRLKFSLFEIVGNYVYFCKAVTSEKFTVFSAKKFPGMEESTPLTKLFAEQGLKIRVRKEQNRLKGGRPKNFMENIGSPERQQGLHGRWPPPDPAHTAPGGPSLPPHLHHPSISMMEAPRRPPPVIDQHPATPRSSIELHQTNPPSSRVSGTDREWGMIDGRSLPPIPGVVRSGYPDARRNAGTISPLPASPHRYSQSPAHGAMPVHSPYSQQSQFQYYHRPQHHRQVHPSPSAGQTAFTLPYSPRTLPTSNTSESPVYSTTGHRHHRAQSTHGSADRRWAPYHIQPQYNHPSPYPYQSRNNSPVLPRHPHHYSSVHSPSSYYDTPQPHQHSLSATSPNFPRSPNPPITAGSGGGSSSTNTNNRGVGSLNIGHAVSSPIAPTAWDSTSSQNNNNSHCNVSSQVEQKRASSRIAVNDLLASDPSPNTSPKRRY